MEIKKITEAVLVGGVLAVGIMASPEAKAATSISSTSTGQTIQVTAGAASGFVQTDFKLTLSANTSMQYTGDNTAIAVNAAHQRGMHHFGGSTYGGSVSACEASSVSLPTATAPSSPSNGC